VGGCGGRGVIAGTGVTAAVADALRTREAGHEGKVDIILLRAIRNRKNVSHPWS
jgi:hypothetical protein